MMRFGLPVLLSAAYVGLMMLVFSSDFAERNSFLIPQGQNIEMMVEDEFPLMRAPDPHSEPEGPGVTSGQEDSKAEEDLVGETEQD